MRWVGWTLAALAVLVAAAVASIGWYYAGEIEREALAVSHEPSERDLVIAAVTDTTVTLRTTEASDAEFGSWRTPGVWGLDWEGGFGRVGEVLELRDGEVVRAFTAIRGVPKTGDAADLTGGAFEGDPAMALGLPFETVTFPSEHGPLSAWKIAGASRTWAILVHGKGATREGMLRYLSAFVSAGLPALVIEYRNDENTWNSESGYYDYGLSEWRDLEAAVRFALGEGADGVVLFGASMGGGIVMNFLYRSDFADRVEAVILDAPMLSFSDTVDFGAERRNLPGLLTLIGKTAASIRFGLSWTETDYLRDTAKLGVPILVFHGDADRLVHIRTSEALASARPDLVTLVRVADAPHAHSWNMDPKAYEQAIGEFLRARSVE
jgi:alpha-beta hydrolase superfamily lysophospholipase